MLNVHRLLYMLDPHNPLPAGSVAMSMDTEPVFDSLEWEFLYRMIDVMGLGDEFISWTCLF